MIYDNVADDGYDFLLDFWPSGAAGSILVTTRNRGFAHRFSTTVDHCLEPVDVETGKQILLSLLPETVVVRSDTLLESICKELGCLPLALSQMAGFIIESDCSLMTFLEIYREQKNRIKLHTSSASASTLNYRHTVSTVWSVSLNSLESKSADSAALLDLLSILDPDGVPTKLFRLERHRLDNIPSKFSWLGNALDYQTAVQGLLSHNLVKTDPLNGKLWIHRLLQFRSLETMDPDRCQISFDVTFFLLFDAFEFPLYTHAENLETLWHSGDLYLPHVLSWLNRYRELRANIKIPNGLIDFISRFTS